MVDTSLIPLEVCLTDGEVLITLPCHFVPRVGEELEYGAIIPATVTKVKYVYGKSEPVIRNRNGGPMPPENFLAKIQVFVKA